MKSMTTPSSAMVHQYEKIILTSFLMCLVLIIDYFQIIYSILLCIMKGTSEDMLQNLSA